MYYPSFTWILDMAKPKRYLAGFLAAAFILSATPVSAQQVQTQAPVAVTDSVQKKPDVAAMTEWRRDFHANPETAYEEMRTAAKINDLLKSWGLETHTNIGKTGVVGILRGAPGAGAICLRADIDALPMTEQNPAIDYASKNAGKAHGCGHDGHAAMLLGAAKYLAETKNFAGTVYFIFQPAEEGGAGAKAMIDDGLFDIVKCDGIYGMHAWPGMKAGEIAVSEGNITAASDNFTIRLKGKGGHAAYPADNIDAIKMAAEIVAELHKMRDATAPAGEGAVLAITMLHGGEAMNVMPEKIEMSGTVRTFGAETQTALEKGIKETAERIAKQYGATVEVEYKRGYPSVFNSADQTANARAAAEAVLGKNNVRPFARTMAGEDFSFFAQRIPGAYVAFGQWDGVSPKGTLHSPTFNFNDATLETGASYWIKLVETQLKPAPVSTIKPENKTP
jgi:amidohydrolase